MHLLTNRHILDSNPTLESPGYTVEQCCVVWLLLQMSSLEIEVTIELQFIHSLIKSPHPNSPRGFTIFAYAYLLARLNI